MNSRALILTILAAAMLSACSGLQLLNTMAPRRGDPVITADIAYGTHPAQRLDLYRPEGEGPFPVLLFIHGGSWSWGDRKPYAFVGRRFAAEGYLTAVMSYRLTPEGAYPGFMEDSAAALAFLHREAATYDGDADRLFVAGHSAGAYNAVQVALAPEFLAAHGLSPAIIDGVGGLAGPYDFLPLDEITAPVFGAAADLAATQPVNRVTPDAPPIFLGHGDADPVVWPRNSERLAARLAEVGARTELRLYPGARHSALIVAVAFGRKYSVVDDMLAFFAAEPATTSAGAAH